MKDLIIVGAGGHGREILECVYDVNKNEPTWNVLGFIDDDPNALDGTGCRLSVVGKLRDWDRFDGIRFALGVSHPKTKESVSAALIERGAKFASIIHPSVRIAQNARYGVGFVAYEGARLCSNVRVGDFVTILSSKIGHDCVVNDYCTILSYCGINGNTTLGKRAFIGNHAAIVQGRRIGQDAAVGIGSVVLNDVPDGIHVFGNPARSYQKVDGLQ